MKPLYLKLENINSFREEQTVDFESLTKGERIFCISGDTGSGKSTIFTAMLLALYHRPQGSKLEDFINLSADKGKIEFAFEENGEKYVVRRVLVRSGNGRITLHKNGESIAEGNEVFAKTEEIIGLEMDQFTQVALLEQGKFGRFLESQPADRARTLGKILSLERFNGLIKIVNSRLSKVLERANLLTDRINRMEEEGKTKARLKELKGGLKPLAKQIDGLKKAQTETNERLAKNEGKRKLHDEIIRLNKEYTLALSTLESTEQRLAELKNKSANPDAEIAEIISQESELKNALKIARQINDELFLKKSELELSRKKYIAEKTKADALEKELADSLNNDVDNAVALILSVKKEGDECPVCGGSIKPRSRRGGGAIDRAEKERRLATLKANLQNMISEGKRLGGEVEKLENRKAEEITPLGDIAKRLDGVTRRRTELETLRAELSRVITANSENRAKTETLRLELASKGKDEYDESEGKLLTEKARSLTAELESALRKQSTDEREITLIESALIETAEFEKELKTLSAQEKNLNRLATLFKSDGFSKFVAEEYIKEFTVTASNVLNRLSGGNYTLVYENNEFKIRDFLNENKERKVKTLSGGETFLASLSIAVAIIRYISAGKSIEFFFLDEGFGTLHEEAVETVVNALRELSKDVTVGLISHVDDLTSRIPNHIRVIHANDSHGSLID